MRTWSCTGAVLLALAGTAAAAPASKRPAVKAPALSVKGSPVEIVPPTDGLPLPPELGAESAEGGDEFGDPPPLTPQQRLQEFDLHISRAQRAERESRIDDAIRE